MLSRTMSRTIAVVGPGRVGQTLGRALRRRGYRIGVVAARSLRRARQAVKFIGGAGPANKLGAELVGADTLLVAVPDRQIAAVAKELARVGGRTWRGKVVLHTSGARAARELAALGRLGAHCGSLHPLFPFPQPLRWFPRGVFFGIEGDPVAVRRARELARALGGEAIRVPPRQKVLYHAAAAMVSGHLLTLADLGARVLRRIGVPMQPARRALLPLIRHTLDQYARLGERAWTGPLARGDAETVWEHLAALEKLPPYFLPVYATLGRAAVALYRKKKVGDSKAQRFLRGRK